MKPDRKTKVAIERLGKVLKHSGACSMADFASTVGDLAQTCRQLSQGWLKLEARHLRRAQRKGEHELLTH